MARCCVRLSSVCRLSVCYVCVVAKRYVLSKNCLNKQIGLSDRYPAVPISAKRGYWVHPQILALRIAPKPIQLAAWLLLYWYRNDLSNSTIADPCSPKIGVPTPKIFMAHYGQTVSVQWLLLTDYRRLPILPFPQTWVLTRGVHGSGKPHGNPIPMGIPWERE